MASRSRFQHGASGSAQSWGWAPQMTKACWSSVAIMKVKGGWGERANRLLWEPVQLFGERFAQFWWKCSKARCYATAHRAVLQLMIQTTLKQLCEAVELQTYKDEGTRNRAGSRQAGYQDRTASQLKTNRDKHTEHAVPTVWPIWWNSCIRDQWPKQGRDKKERRDRERGEREREEVTRTEQDPPPKHPPLYWPAVYPFIIHRSHLPELQPLSFQNLWGSLGWRDHLHEYYPRAAVFPHLSTDFPQQEGTPLFGEHWMYLHRLCMRTPFSQG